MNNKIATGIWLVFIGILTLLYNFKVIDFNFYAALQMWPLLLVSIGLSLLIQNKKNATPIIIIVNLILCAFIFHRGITSKETIWENLNINTHDEVSEDFTSQISHPFDSVMQNAKLTINGGASKLNLIPATNSTNLIYSQSNFEASSLLLDVKGEENVKLDLTTKVKNNQNEQQSTNIELNQSPIWDFEFNLGAAKIHGDLKDFKIKDLEVNSGASHLTLYLPQPSQGTSNIEINTAASKIFLYLPKETECKVQTDAIFSNNKYEDIDVIEEDARKTKNYDSASNKYEMKITGAANSLSILRY